MVKVKDQLKVEMSLQSPKQVKADVVFVTQSEDKKKLSAPAPYQKLLKGLQDDKVFTGALGSQSFVRNGGEGGAESVLFLGLGPVKAIVNEKVRVLGSTLWQKAMVEKLTSIRIDPSQIPGDGSTDRDLLFRSFLEGVYLSSYKFEGYKSTKDEKKKEQEAFTLSGYVVAKGKEEKELKKTLDHARLIFEATAITRNFSNEPSNIGTPPEYAKRIEKLAQHYGLKCTVLGPKDLAKEKMNLILGVSQGSVCEPRVVLLEYNPSASKKSKKSKTIGFVGKGVTFDSGGISIKPAARMEEMKHDMTGAATVLGATILASLWEVPHKVVTIMAFTENMPSGSAIVPGVVIESRNGKTVEIVNTDAEGRLILADALDYIQTEYKLDMVIDVATLTGAIGVALGPLCCGLFSNDDGLVKDLEEAASSYHERMWRLPVFDDYFDDMRSEYADMKNISNSGTGGASRGAVFLKQFIKSGMPWAHFDIAYTGYNLGHIPYCPKIGASGFHVRTLAQFAKDLK